MPAPFTIATDMVALELQNPMLATPSFINATGNGANGWTNLSYAQLANAYDKGLHPAVELRAHQHRRRESAAVPQVPAGR